MHVLESYTTVWVGKTPPWLVGRENSFARSDVMHLSLGWYDSTFANGQDKSRLQHMWSCTRVKVVKTPQWLTGNRNFVYNICSYALEFEWARLPPCQWAGEKSFATSKVLQWSLGG